MSLIAIVVSLFLIANPIGNVPIILVLLKGYSLHEQRTILLRESFIAFAIALFFLFAGRNFLEVLGLQQYAVTLCGGIMLLLVALKMIFPIHIQPQINLQQQLLIVPIATPLISGPALMTMLMIYAHQGYHYLLLTVALSLTYIGVAVVLLSAPYLQRILGKRGMEASEQMMGMLLTIMSGEMIVRGTVAFLQNR